MFFDDREQGHVFFDGEAAYVAEDEFVFEGASSAGGVEEVGVYAALHEVAGAVGGAFEEGAEFEVGGEEDFGLAIEVCGGPEGCGFYAGFGEGCVGWG